MTAPDRCIGTMPRSPHLPDIRDLTDDRRPDRARRFNSALGAVLVCLSLATIVLAADAIWDLREGSPFPPIAHGVFAALLITAPVATGLVSARREGRGMLVLLAVIAPAVVWLLLCCFVFVLHGVQA